MTIYKIRVWNKGGDKERRSSVYVFIGNVPSTIYDILETKITKQGKLTKAETEKLKKHFGEDFETQIGKDLGQQQLIFVKSTINDDDNMNVIAKKLVVYLEPYLQLTHPEDLYLWSEVKRQKSFNDDLTFINNCFRADALVKYSEFYTWVYNHFGETLEGEKFKMVDKQQALKLLASLKTSSTCEPLLFKYASEGFLEYVNYNPLKQTEEPVDVSNLSVDSLSSMTLSSFNLTSEVIEVVTSKDFDAVYFPFKTSPSSTDFQSLVKFVKQLDSIENEVNNYTLSSNYIVKTYITFYNIRCNDNNFNSPVNLNVLFDKIHTTAKIPFIKYKTRSNVFYKIYKDKLASFDSKDLDKWTFYKTSIGKYANRNFVTMKMVFDDKCYCSLTVYDTLSIDVKFNLGIEAKASIHSIRNFYKDINDVIDIIKQLYPKSIVQHVSDQNSKIINLVTYSIIGFEKQTIKFANISTIISQTLFPYFNIIPSTDKNVLHLQYKKVDNYIKYDNLQAFITLHYGAPKDVVIAKLMGTYVMSKEDAEKEYTKWSTSNEVEMTTGHDNKLKYKPKTDNFVNLKLKVSEAVDTKFIISGLKTFKDLFRLTHLIQVFLDLSNKKVEKVTGLDANAFDEQVYVDKPKSDAVNFKDIEKLDTGDMMEADANNAEDDNDEDVDPDFLALEQEMQETVGDSAEEVKQTFVDKVAEDLPGVSKEAPKGKAPGPVLGLLKDADKNLFDWTIEKETKGKKRTDFPSICGWTDTRQPIPISQAEKDKIDSTYPDAYDDFLHTGSTKELAEKNIYICPKVWCPKSRVAMSYQQFQDAQEQCPFEGEKPVLFNKYWGKSDQVALKSPHHIGFLKDSIHPNHYCLPCCFKKPMTEAKRKANKCFSNFKDTKKPDKGVAVPDSVKKDDDDVYGNEKYIKGEFDFPLYQSRFGILPKDLAEILGNKRCGNRHDGTGLMENGAECYLRKGLTHCRHSFVSCLLQFIDLPQQIKSCEDFLQYVAKNMTVHDFIMLENGKLLRMFINPAFDIHVSHGYLEFKKWFLSQEDYILQHTLQKVRQDLMQNTSKTFDESLHASKEVLREFMIYNSFKHFVLFLLADHMPKDHKTLLDLVNVQHTWLNEKKRHVIVIEVDPQSNKSTILCPYNRTVKESIDIKNPFVILVKKNNYYESLCRVKLLDGDLTVSPDIMYDLASPEMQRLLEYYVNNCGMAHVEHSTQSYGENIALYLESMGYRTKRYVIDFSFRVKGLLLKNNVFVPFRHKMDLYNVAQGKFIYYNDIVDFKCTYKKEEIQKKVKEIFNLVKHHTKDDYYDIQEFVKDDGISAVRLKENVIVPLHIRKDMKIFKSFEGDLEIFIQHEIDDARVKMLKIVKQNIKLFDVLFNGIMNAINSYDDLRMEVDFLTNSSNPFPKNFKRMKLMKLLQEAAKKVVLKSSDSKAAKDAVDALCQDNAKECMMACEVDDNNEWAQCLTGIPKEKFDLFLSKMIETFLTSTTMKAMFIVSTTSFKPSLSEYLFDQHQINTHKLDEIVSLHKNPLKTLSEKLEELTDAYVLNKPLKQIELASRYITPKTQYKKIPVSLRKLKCKDFDIIEDESLNPTKLYGFFVDLNEFVNPRKVVTIDMLKSIIKTRIISNFKKDDTIQEFFDNPRIVHIIKTHYLEIGKKEKPPVSVCLDMVDSIDYFPSLFDIRVMAAVVGVNVALVGRVSTKKDADGFEYMYNKAAFTIIVLQSYDRVNKLDRFELFTKDKKIIAFRNRDVPTELARILYNKRGTYEIEVTE